MSGSITVQPCRHGPFMFLMNDVYIGRSLALYGEYSEGEVDLFRRILPMAAEIVEVGANIGTLTVPLARIAGPLGRVLAFEPQATVFNMLCGNIALNELDNTTATRCALGAKPGRIRIPRLGYGAQVNFGGVSAGEGEDEVEVITLDSLSLKKCDLIKIDVEGHELRVLKGGRQTLRKLRPTLFVENDIPEQHKELITWLRAEGYRLWWYITPLYNPNNFRKNAENIFGETVSYNMLCVPQDRCGNVSGFPEVGPNDEPHPLGRR